MTVDIHEVASPAARRYLQLQRARHIGPICAQRLVSHFGSVDAVFAASLQQLERVEGIGRYRAEGVVQARADEPADLEIEAARRHGVRLICREDPDYPKLLLHTPDPPICLYVRGKLLPEDGLAVAIVGSRRTSHYGLEQAERFGGLLATAGFTVVSGMARGADGAAHRGALRAGGRTVAVLGSGLGNLYPPEHAELALQIQENGALLSELPIDTPPDPGNFPPRNRIIVGMALGVLIVEAGKQSGALISARLACEYNREVFALPGMVHNPYAFGTNALIRDGEAKLVTCLEDLLDELGEAGRLLRPTTTGDTEGKQETQVTRGSEDVLSSPPAPPLRLDENERLVLDAISCEGTPLDLIAENCTLSAPIVAANLTKLLIKGAIAQRPGNVFCRRARP